MFDLFRSRDKAVRIMLGGLLLLVALSMLTYLVPSYNMGGSGASDQVVAEVGKDAITVPEVQQIVQMNMRGRQLPAALMPSYVPRFIDSMVTERALAFEARQLGFKVSDEDLAAGIRQTLPQLFQDGKFAGKEAYASVLMQQNMTIAQFEDDMSRQLLVTKMRNVALEGTVVTPQEVEQEYRKRNDKVKIQYVKISGDKLRSEVQPTPEELRKYYEANKPLYQIPEKRDLGILIVDQAKLEQTIQPTEADLLRVYNDNKDTYRLPERVDVQHILLKTDDKDPNKSDAAIKPKAEDLVKQLQKPGVNFSEMAKKYSEDPGSKENGGEYDGVVRGQMVPEFEKAAFSLKVGEISAPVKTTYGYHILKVLKHEQAQLKPFNDVKAQMEAEFKKQRVNDLMQQLSDKVQAALTKDPLHPDKVAADLGVQYVVAANVGASDPLPEVGVNKEFEDAVGGLKKGDVSQPVVLTGNTQIAMAVCTGEIPAHPSSFDEVQSKVRDAVGKDKLAKLVAAVAHFTTAVELDPNFITARLYLATAYMQQYIPGGDSPDNLQMAKAAYDQFQEVLTRDPNNEMAVASIASLLFNEKKLDESNEWNLKLIALNPKNKEAYYTLGVIAWTKAWVVDGEARTKLGMKPEDPGPLKDKKVRAEVGAKNGPIIDEGFRDLDKALQIDPEYDDAMAYENLLYRQKADLEDSSDAYKADIDKANDYFQKTIDTRKIKAERTCVEEATARSPNVATQPVNIRITNQRSNASKIYWLNQQGQRVFYMTLESGAFYTQPTYSEHPWVATDNDGHCTMFFVATTAPHQEVTIR